MKKLLLLFVFFLSHISIFAFASAENKISTSWSKTNLHSIKPMTIQTGDPYWEAQGGTVPPGLSGTVNAIAVSGSDVYVGGVFSSMGGNPTAAYIAKWNGTSWEALGTGVNGNVNAITVSGSDIYVGGSFTTAGGISTPGIARWDGSAWNSVGGGITGSNVRAIAVSGSNVYVGGAFTDANGNTNADNIALWDGVSWNALGTGLSSTVNAIAVGNNKIYVGGNFQNAGGDANADRVAYWDLDSVKWKSMSTGSASQVFSLAFQSDTSLYVGLASAPGIRKWNGTAFSTIGSTSLSSAVRTILLQGSEIIVGGDFTFNSPRLVRIAKWTGSAWQSVDSLSNSVNTIASSADGKLYIGGAFTNEHSMYNANYIVQWNGTRLLPIGTGIANIIKAIVSSGTTVSVGGEFLDADTLTKADYAARWNGFTWSAMQSGFKGPVYSMSQTGTTIFAGGSFTQLGIGTTVNNVARWNGSSWATMTTPSAGTGTNGAVNAVAAVTTTRAYVGGSFTTAGGSAMTGIARWTNGVGWEALRSGVSGGNVYALALSGTKLYVGGDFTSADGVANTSRIAVWDTATATWSALGSGISNNTVYSIVVNGTDIYVGGDFTDAGGVSAADKIAKWDGSTWSSVGTGTEINNTVRTMAFLGTDLYVGGDFTDAAGYSGGDYIAKWNGSTWSALGNGANNKVYAIIAAGSDLYAGGEFTSIDGASAARFARYRVPDVTAPSKPTVVVNATVGEQSLTIKWKKNSEVDFSKYRVYTGTDSNSVSQTDSSTSISDTSRVLTGLTNGTKYYARISAVDIWGNQSAASVAISGTPNDTTPPSTPTLISATGGNLTIDLTWSKNNNSDFKRYRIYRGTSPGATAQIDSVSLISDTTKTISALIPGVTLYYRIRTLDSANNLSGYSNELSASSVDQTPPSAITGLSTTAGDTTVTLRWRQSTASDFGKYYIYMDTLALPLMVVDSSFTKSDTARTFTHLTNGKTYYFRVTAADTFANVSAFSSVASATPFDQTAPSAPQNLTASAGDALVVLRWDANTENDLLRYRIFVGTSSGSEVQTDSTTHDSIIVNGLNNNTLYYFRIAALDTGKNQSGYSNEVSVTPFSPNAPPANPTLLSAVSHNQSVTLTWQKNADPDILKYFVYAGLSANPTLLVDSTNGDTTITLSGLTNEQLNYFRLTAVDSANQVSGYSNELSQTPYDDDAPATPLNFVAVAGDQSVQITWNNDSAEPIKNYRVFVNGTQVDSLTDTTYTVMGLTNYTTYQLSVAAVDSNNNVSSYTSEIPVTPIDLTAPSVPSNLTVVAGDQSVVLTWFANPESDLARYRVFINNVQIDSTSDTLYTAGALTNYTSYSFKIAAVDTSGNFSGFVSTTSMPYDQTPPSTPSDLSATAGDGQVTLNWTANSENDLERYRIYMNGTQVDSTTSNSYTKTDLTNYTIYNFQLSAVDTSKNASAKTSTVEATPYDQTPPSVPQDLIATAGDEQVTLNWTANSENDFARYRIYMNGTQVDSTTSNSYTKTGLTNYTTYNFQLSAVDTSRNVSALISQVSSMPYDQTAPTVPQDLIATAGDEQVTLNWTANTESDFARYRVYMNGTQVDSTTSNSYTKTGLTNYTTYNFQLSAVDTSRNVSALISQVSSMPYDQTAPAVPQNLTATAGDGQVTLNWTANSENDLARYRIYVNGTQVDSTTGNSYSKTGLTNYSSYSFSISAVDTSKNESAKTSTVDATPNDQTPPSVPQDLIATAGDGKITLNWTANSESDLAHYRVYMNGTQVDSTTSNSYTKTGLTNYTTYNFQLSAVDTSRNASALMSQVSSMPYDQTAPAEVTGLSIITGDGALTLNWTANGESDFKAYRLYMGTTPNPTTQVDSVTTIATTSKEFNGLVNGTTYYYRMVAVDTSGNVSDYSDEVSSMPYDQTAPAVPQNLTATAGDGQVTLNWTANSENDLARYRIYVNDMQVDSVVNNSRTVTGLTNDVTYTFKIAAVDTGRNFSAYSNQVSATPTDMAAPTKPIVLTATAGNTNIVLTWRKNIEPDVVRYRVYRGTTASPTTQVDSTTSASDTTRTYSGLNNGTTYFFRITAVDGHGNFSAYSDDISAKPLDAPGTLTVSLFQNKAAKKYAQITVVSTKALSAVPTVTAKLGANNTLITMTAIASSNQQFRGGFIINNSGNYILQTAAQTLNGRDTTVQREFNAVIAKSGEAATVASIDGKVTLKLNRATLNEETVLLSEQSEDGVYTFTADADANGNMILEMEYDPARYADPSKLFVYRMEKDTWSKQRTQVFTKTTTLKAQVEAFGTYKIVYDESFDGSNIVPMEFALQQNYPNPFNPTTTIRYDLRDDETVSLKIYNMLGQEVRTLRKGFQIAGEYRIQWDGRNNAGQVVSSGVYIYRLETKSFRATKKMMFLK